MRTGYSNVEQKKLGKHLSQAMTFHSKVSYDSAQMQKKISQNRLLSGQFYNVSIHNNKQLLLLSIFHNIIKF